MHELHVSKHEENLMASLKLYDILDSPIEAEFDALAKMAAEICKTPVATIAFLDEKRVWFKSHIGLTINEMPKD